MSVTKDMQALREILGVESNAEVIIKVAELQAGPLPQPDRYIVTVAWTQGTPARSAQVNILQPDNAPIVFACDTLQAGLAVLNTRLGAIAADAIQKTERLQKQLKEERDASMDKSTKPVPVPGDPKGPGDDEPTG